MAAVLPPRAAARCGMACRLFALVLAVWLAGCGMDASAFPESERRAGPLPGASGAQFHWLPVVEAGGNRRLILARICRPALAQPAALAARPSGGTLLGAASSQAAMPKAVPYRLVVINHGKSTSPRDRANQRTAACDAEAVRWFLDRRFVAVLPLRRGYGVTGGTMAEALPRCAPGREYAVAALETARDIQAAINYATAMPGVRADDVVVVGQSAGGLGTIAYSSLNDPRVAALVNMAGGDGGRVDGRAHSVCEPSALVRATARFGGSGRTPMVWIYTANDSYFAPAVAAAMHRAYQSGGGRALLHALPAFGRDGHTLFFARGGSAVWGPLVARFLDVAPADGPPARGT